MTKPTYQFKFTRLTQMGFGMIEILISVAVVVTILTAVASGLAFSLKTSSELKFRGIALAKAQELMEAIRRERTLAGWDNFFVITAGGPGVYTYCFNDDNSLIHDTFNWATDACPDTVNWDGNDYIRELTVDTSVFDQVDLTTTVYWQGRDKKIELKQILNKWH